jgi:hypothetical protein
MRDGWIWADEELLATPPELAWDGDEDDDEFEDDLDEEWDDEDLDEEWDEDDDDEEWEEFEEEFEEEDEEPLGGRRSGRQKWN